MDEKFAFVSINTDLYNLTCEGLKFFYDRFSNGEHILVHDHNHNIYVGVKEAIRRFCCEKI